MKYIFWLLPGMIAFATASSAQNRPTVSLTVAQPLANEGQGGAAVLVVRLSQATPTTLRVFYRLSGNARNGVDYERLQGSMDILAGSTEGIIEILPLDDTRREPTERVTVQLRPAPRNSAQYRLGARRAQTVQILDDEQPVATPRPPVARQRGPWSALPVTIIISTNAP
jgi:hypothetical protein